MDEKTVELPDSDVPRPPPGFTLKIVGVTIASVAFACSLVYPAVHAEGDNGSLPGVLCLMLGWDHLAWWANPFLLMSAWFLWHQRTYSAAACATAAILLSLNALQLNEIFINEAGTTAPVAMLGAGYYLWIGSGIVLLLTSVLGTLASFSLRR